MKVEAGAEVRGRAFLYPGLYVSSSNSPWGRRRPEQRKKNSNQSHDAQSVFLSSAHRGGEFAFLSDADERVVVCLGNGWVFSCEGWPTALPRCSVCRLFGNPGFYFCSMELNYIWICCKDGEKSYTLGVFYTTLPRMYFFCPQNTRLCVFSPTGVPLKCVWCGQMQKRSSCLGFNHYPNLIWVQWAIDGY